MELLATKMTCCLGVLGDQIHSEGAVYLGMTRLVAMSFEQGTSFPAGLGTAAVDLGQEEADRCRDLADKT